MIDGDTMQRIVEDATERARKNGLQPGVPSARAIAAWRGGADLAGPGFRFPLLGEYVPKGWRLLFRHFVDVSGFGTSGEPAMTQSALARMIAAPSRAGHGWALIEQHQFQGWVGEYEYEAPPPYTGL